MSNKTENDKLKSKSIIAATKEEKDFKDLIKRVSEYVAKVSGNVLEERQFSMIDNRLRSRMLSLNISDPNEYSHYIEKNRDTELNHLIGLLTTHHTFFFREFIHFDYLLTDMKRIVASVKKRGEKKIRIWSAACSLGQEVYSLSIFFSTHLKEIDPEMDFEIIGSDIDSNSVKYAQNGVYNRKEIKEIPLVYLSDNFTRGKDEIADFVKVKSKISNKCTFETLNLLQIPNGHFRQKFDVIFCRNVLIYFKDPDIKKCIEFFKNSIHEEGLLVTGISESLLGRIPYAISAGPSCYRLHQNKVEKAIIGTPLETVRNVSNTQKPKEEKVYNILCVDDSPSILKILQKVFLKEEGFHIVGTAGNGIEAEAMLKKHKVDLMTLDIHMPEMDGISYLRKNFNPDTHPPVVMISSVSREDQDFAHKALVFGASDFVEKPTLDKFVQQADEIRMKAKVAIKRFQNKNSKNNSDPKTNTVTLSSFDKEFGESKKMTQLNSKLLVIYASISDQDSLATFFKNLKGENPPVVILTQGNSQILKTFANVLQDRINEYQFSESPVTQSVLTGQTCQKVFVSDFSSSWEVIVPFMEKKQSILMVFGSVTKDAEQKFLKLTSKINIVLEEGEYSKGLENRSTEICPVTSFHYLIRQMFDKAS